MKCLLLLTLLALPAFPQATQQSGQNPPTAPGASAPEEAPVASSGKGKGGAASELTGVNSTEDGVMSLGKYQGGSWAAKPANKVTTYVNQREIVVLQNKQRFAIPVKSVTEVVYGNDAQARVGKDAGVSVVPAGAKAQAGSATDVGIVWAASSGKSGVVLRIEKGDFDNCMNALQNVTGLAAVNTGKPKGR